MTTSEVANTDNGLLGSVTQEELEHAALKASGFDPAKTSRAELVVVMSMAKEYELKLNLGHLVPIQGKPYITRDGLLHVAHRSGQLGGVVLEDEGHDEKEGWWAVVSVYRNDWKKPCTFRGRYNGPNRKFGPELAVKCAEMMCYRRAFDVSLPAEDERWDLDTPKQMVDLAPIATPIAQIATPEEYDEAYARGETVETKFVDVAQYEPGADLDEDDIDFVPVVDPGYPTEAEEQNAYAQGMAEVDFDSPLCPLCKSKMWDNRLSLIHI